MQKNKHISLNIDVLPSRHIIRFCSRRRADVVQTWSAAELRRFLEAIPQSVGNRRLYNHGVQSGT